MKLIVGFVALSSLFLHSDARPSFIALVPNGNRVAGVAALGHANTSGGGATNAFGEAFEAAGHEWTKELCQTDSDGDGATNGEELGDPCCTWTSTTGFDDSTSSAAMQSPTHPGVANSFTAEQLAAMVCHGEADLDSVGSSGAATSTSSLPAPGSLTSTPSAFGSSSSSAAFDDMMAPERQPHLPPAPNLDQTSATPATSGADTLKTSVLALYCFSVMIACALAM